MNLMAHLREGLVGVSRFSDGTFRSASQVVRVHLTMKVMGAGSRSWSRERSCSPGER
jgi:hypothetical protein